MCALSAYADKEVSIVERYSIDFAFENEPSLQFFDKDKVIRMLDDFLYCLRQEGESAKSILYNKVRRIAGDYKKSRTLMRVAYLIISADRDIRDSEMVEFTKLGALLGLEPDQISDYLST